MPDNEEFFDGTLEGEPESGALVRQPAGAIDILAPVAPVMNLETAKARLKTLQEFIEFYLVEDEDYGTIPGTQKPALFKSGADKLCEIYGLTDRYREIRSVIDWELGLFDYEFQCILYRGPRVVTVGMGSCSSFESKYRYRDAARKCPECGRETIIKGKEQYGGGWVCYKKKGGCGAKFVEEDHAILTQPVGRIPNPDISDLKNTIIKMAKKRAKVDATLSATRSSGIFTQADDEEGEKQEAGAPKGEGAKQAAAANPSGYISEPERRAVFAAAGRAHVNHDDLKRYLSENFNVDSTAKMSREVADKAIEWLDAIAKGEGEASHGEDAGS